MYKVQPSLVQWESGAVPMYLLPGTPHAQRYFLVSFAAKTPGIVVLAKIMVDLNYMEVTRMIPRYHSGRLRHGSTNG
jgi:hypothetical protein